MTTLSLRNHRGDTVEVESISATEAQNTFGQLLDRTIAGRVVAITRHREPRAVLLSIEEYRALTQKLEDPIDRLRGEDCRPHLAHTLPSERMLTDALAQFLVSKRWRNVLALVGSHPHDALLARSTTTRSAPESTTQREPPKRAPVERSSSRRAGE